MGGGGMRPYFLIQIWDVCQIFFRRTTFFITARRIAPPATFSSVATTNSSSTSLSTTTGNVQPFLYVLSNVHQNILKFQGFTICAYFFSNFSGCVSSWQICDFSQKSSKTYLWHPCFPLPPKTSKRFIQIRKQWSPLITFSGQRSSLQSKYI